MGLTDHDTDYVLPQILQFAGPTFPLDVEHDYISALPESLLMSQSYRWRSLSFPIPILSKPIPTFDNLSSLEELTLRDDDDWLYNTT